MFVYVEVFSSLRGWESCLGSLFMFMIMLGCLMICGGSFSSGPFLYILFRGVFDFFMILRFEDQKFLLHFLLN